MMVSIFRTVASRADKENKKKKDTIKAQGSQMEYNLFIAVITCNAKAGVISQGSEHKLILPLCSAALFLLLFWASEMSS